jgi:hypothetical protein
MPEGFGVDEVEPVRLVHSPLEPHDLQFGGEVDQRLNRMGHRDAEADDDGFGIEGGPSADLDPLSRDRALPPDGDVDPPRLLEADPPQLCRAPVTEHGVVPAGEHRGHPPSLRRQIGPSTA